METPTLFTEVPEPSTNGSHKVVNRVADHTTPPATSAPPPSGLLDVLNRVGPADLDALDAEIARLRAQAAALVAKADTLGQWRKALAGVFAPGKAAARTDPVPAPGHKSPDPAAGENKHQQRIAHLLMVSGPMRFTDAELTAAVAASYGTSGPAALPAHWAPIVPRANRAAYNAVRSVLFGRGFTPAQANAWDDRCDWNTTVGVCLAFWYASKADEDRGEPFRREYEALMEDLESASIVIAGDIVNPTGAGTRIGSGSFDTGSDIHTMDDVL